MQTLWGRDAANSALATAVNMTARLHSLEEQAVPAHTAVLVLDMQNDFCAEGGYLQQSVNPT